MNRRNSAPVPNDPAFMEQRFRLLVESLRDYAVFMIDLDGNISSWNPGVEQVLGYAEADFVGRPFADLFTPQDVAQGAPAQELQRTLATGRSDDKREHLRKDGSRFRADGVVTLMRDPSGQPLAFSKVMHDVTSEHVAAEALRDSEERCRMMVDSVSDYAIFLLDASGRVASWTQSAERMKGYRQDEILGKHFSIFFTPEDQARGMPEHELQSAIANGRAEGEGWRVRRDGTRFWSNEVVAPIRTNAGLRGFAKVVRDLTDRQRAALEREQLYTEAQEANRLKDEFLGTVSHELRTPLNAILGWAHLLETDDLNLDEPRQRRALRAIARNAEVQVQLVNDLLDVSRIISGKMRLQVTTVDLAAVLHAAVEAVQPAARAKGVDLQVTLDPAADTISADGDRLQQIVWNLLANAIKFTPSGGRVELRTSRNDQATEIVVTDTGAGVPKNVLPFIFDRFRQADSSTTRQYGGVGLGLAIVRHLVELHGGHVDATSAGPGSGATFTVRFPTTAVLTSSLEQSPSPASPVLRTERFPALTNLRVVVLDDDADAREVLSVVLRRAGADVQAVESAAEAFNVIKAFTPDVIIADIGMPEADGYAFIQQLRTAAPDPVRKTPAIAVTSYARAEDRRRALDSGFQLHVPKPFEPRAIIDAVYQIASNPA